MTSEIFGRLKRLTRRPVSNAAGEEQSGARLRIVSAVRQVLLWGDTPDAFAGWIPFAVIQGWRLARKWRPRVIYASGPPFSVVCAAGVLCRLLAIPLVADFRDPWTLDASDPIGMLSGKFSARQTVRRVKLLRKLEKWILAHSAAVLFTSDETRKLYVRQYPGVEGKSFVIYNGADSDDFLGEIRTEPHATIAHVGTLHEFQWEQVRLFLDGFALAYRKNTLPSDVRVLFVGAMSLNLRERLQATVDQENLSNVVEVRGFVPHAKAISCMRSSRLLLLFAGNGSHAFRLSKISEYLAAGAPILAFASRNSQTADEVLSYGGRVVHKVSIRQVADEVARTLSNPIANQTGLNAIKHPHPLNRRTEAEHVAQIFSRVITTR